MSSTLIWNGVTYTLEDLQNCTFNTCPIAIAHIRYIPTLIGNSVYLGIFGILLTVQIAQGLKYRTWGFLAGVIGGLALEIIGYVGRIHMHYNQFIDKPFFMYVIALTLGPAFLSASIYLCLARIVVVYGEGSSAFKPRFYTITFIICDIISLVLQAVGGALAASSAADEKLGEHIMLAGLSFQVFSLAIFCLLGGIVAMRVHGIPKASRNAEFASVVCRRRFKTFLWGKSSQSSRARTHHS